ncbi:MAG: hypothetical protein J7M18_05710 [Candidatus Eremiobacteraeota bacterium]|nr:hypothetical protein [Candidatus Eremiobacteraeota bacterium]
MFVDKNGLITMFLIRLKNHKITDSVKEYFNSFRTKSIKSCASCNKSKEEKARICGNIRMLEVFGTPPPYTLALFLQSDQHETAKEFGGHCLTINREISIEDIYQLDLLWPDPLAQPAEN